MHDTVWHTAGAREDTILCIGCLEERLGRLLLHTDFPPAVLNQPDYGNHSQRLQDRLRPQSTP
ncbi:hypothetical protein HLB23_36320 [Nocardia uniformis]|uniref:Uncharacterized protein n=1 Tax=Nocardia uniformis TaxID=53432 RepID=A0A849CC06_9NOCA|nr:hypothetical protein [Nocardia uniformis]NNH75258.1 hypothetical protein [Nocardia uniformis]